MRRINFFDGLTTGTAPVLGNVPTTELVTYANDASFEADNQGAPVAGNIYFNTTSNVVRYYNGTQWTIVSDTDSTQTFTNKTINGSNNTITNVSASNVNVAEDLPLAAQTAQAAFKDHEDRITQNETDIAGKIDSTEKGAVNGVASLDGTGKVPAAQLPSYVDDVEEYADFASFPVTGETGKLYIAIDTGLAYRWSGSVYVEISAGPSDTDDLSEGATNLYYTDARADARIAAASIDDLSDVDTSTVTPTDGQSLVWSSADSEWQPRTVSGGGGGGLTVTTTKTGAYSAAIGEFVKCNASGGDFTVTIPNAAGNADGEIAVHSISTGVVTVTNGTDTFYVSTEDETLHLICDGTNFLLKAVSIPNPEVTAVLGTSTSEDFTNGTFNASGCSITVGPGTWNLDAMVGISSRISGGSTNINNYTNLIIRDTTNSNYLVDSFAQIHHFIESSANATVSSIDIQKRTEVTVTTSTTYEIYWSKSEEGGGGGSSSRLLGDETQFGTTVNRTWIRARKVR